MEGNFNGWLEGNIVKYENNLYNILRVDNQKTLEEFSANVLFDSKEIFLLFSSTKDFYTMPGGGKKFTILYDLISNKFISITNVILNEDIRNNFQIKQSDLRNVLALVSSSNLKDWKINTILLKHNEVHFHGFQYVDWKFENENIVFVSRTAFEDSLGNANSFHDANYLTFHVIGSFRNFLD